MRLPSAFILFYAGLAIAQGQNPNIAETTAVEGQQIAVTGNQAEPTAVAENNPPQTPPTPPETTPTNNGNNGAVVENPPITPTPTPQNNNLDNPQLNGQNLVAENTQPTAVTTDKPVVGETTVVADKTIVGETTVVADKTVVGETTVTADKEVVVETTGGTTAAPVPVVDPTVAPIEVTPTTTTVTPVETENDKGNNADNKPVNPKNNPKSTTVEVVPVVDTANNNNAVVTNNDPVPVNNAPAPAPVPNAPTDPAPVTNTDPVHVTNTDPVPVTNTDPVPVTNTNNGNGNGNGKKDPEPEVVAPAPVVDINPAPQNNPVDNLPPKTNNGNGNMPEVAAPVPFTAPAPAAAPAPAPAAAPAPAPVTAPPAASVPTVSDVLNGKVAEAPAPATSPTAGTPSESQAPVTAPSSLPVSNAPPTRNPNTNNILLNSGPGSQNQQEETVARIQPNTDIFQNTRPGETTGGSIAIGTDVIPSNILPPSTPEGQRLLNLLPSLRGYSYNNLRGLPSGVPMFILSIKLPCGDACNPAPHAQRLKFESTIIADIIASVGNDKLTSDKIVVLNVLDINGRTAVQLAFLPLADGTSPFLLVQQLYAQLMDPKSKLLTSGVLSPSLDSTVFGSDIIMPLANDNAVDASSKVQTIVIIVVSIVLYLGLMGIFYIGFRQYKARIKQEEIDRQNSLKETVWEYKELRLDPSKRRQEYDSIIVVDIVDDDDDDELDSGNVEADNGYGDGRPVSYVTYRSSEVKSTSSLAFNSFPRGASARQSGFDPSQFQEMESESEV